MIEEKSHFVRVNVYHSSGSGSSISRSHRIRFWKSLTMSISRIIVRMGCGSTSTMDPDRERESLFDESGSSVDLDETEFFSRASVSRSE